MSPHGFRGHCELVLLCESEWEVWYVSDKLLSLKFLLPVIFYIIKIHKIWCVDITLKDESVAFFFLDMVTDMNGWMTWRDVYVCQSTHGTLVTCRPTYLRGGRERERFGVDDFWGGNFIRLTGWEESFVGEVVRICKFGVEGWLQLIHTDHLRDPLTHSLTCLPRNVGTVSCAINTQRS